MPRLVLITTLAMLAFAANSLLCRVALRDTTIDAASFTAIRLASGAAVLATLEGGSEARQPFFLLGHTSSLARSRLGCNGPDF